MGCVKWLGLLTGGAVIILTRRCVYGVVSVRVIQLNGSDLAGLLFLYCQPQSHTRSSAQVFCSVAAVRLLPALIFRKWYDVHLYRYKYTNPSSNSIHCQNMVF